LPRKEILFATEINIASLELADVGYLSGCGGITDGIEL